jgi:hypothetical protein
VVVKTGLDARALLLGLVLAAFLGACGRGNVAQPVVLSEGTYRVVFGQGYPPADEARLLAITAHLDRASGLLVFSLANGSQQSLTFVPRPQSGWFSDCYTMVSHALNEVADLAPAPLQLESMSFVTPVVYPRCTAQRMILSNAPGNETTFLALDLQ